MIDFKDIEETVINNFYGGKGDIYCRMFKDENGKILVSRVPAKSSIGLHKHEYNSEIVYVISGEIKCILDGKEEIVKGTMPLLSQGSFSWNNQRKRWRMLYF